MVEERHHSSEKQDEPDATGSLAGGRLVGLFRRPAAVIDSANRIVAANPPFCRLFKLDADSVPGGQITELEGVEWRDGLPALLEGLSLGRSERAEFEVRAEFDPAGERILRVTAQPVLCSTVGTEAVPAEQVLLELEDLTEQRRIADYLHLQRTAMESAANAIFITDRQGIIEWANPACERLSGFTFDEVVGKTPRVFKSGKQDREFYRKFWKTLLAGKAWNGRVTNRHKDGHLYTVEQTVTPISDAVDGVTHFVAIHEDITARIESERRIAHMARHDFLTDLPNRFALDERLDLELSRAARYRRSVAVMSLDLDRFKDVNDTFGHATGDRLLIAVANRLKKRRRDVDMVARLGGDEFAILLVDVENAENVVGIAESLLEAFEEPFEIESRLMYMQASVGIGVFSEGELEKEELLKRADLALYRAKNSGGNTYGIYREDMDTETQRRMSLGQDLHTALVEDQLFLEYQPQVDLEDETVIGVEALVRWQHPTFGLVMPSDFVPLAESSGLIGAIGEWVLRTACRQAVAWRDRGIPAMPMAVNISAVQLRDPAFPAIVAEALAETGLEPGFLELELTERVLMDAHPVTEGSLRAINGIGVRLSLDDFGKGYASLDYLRRYPLNKLKIDRSFVRDMGSNNKNATIVGAVIDLATRLDLQVIAEGVEPEELLGQLIEQGCREAQGFYFSRPVPAEELEKILRGGGAWRKGREGREA